MSRWPRPSGYGTIPIAKLVELLAVEVGMNS